MAARPIDGDALYGCTSGPLDDFDDDRTAGPATSRDGDDYDAEFDGASKPTWRIAPPEVEWNHGPLGREDASTILIDHPVGSYLVRESLRSADCSISFRVPAGVKHFKVIRHEYGDFFIADNSFSSLSELVEHYCNEFLCDDMALQRPVAAVGAVRRSSVEELTAVAALTTFAANGPNELSCSQGERLAVLNADDDHWIYVSKAAGTICGFVPKASVRNIETETTKIEADVRSQLPSSFHRTRWIHGNMDRIGAEDLLQEHGQPGAFLIRESGDPGSYTLSFLGPKRVQHFRVRCQGPNDYECGGRAFSCLEAVVLRYFTEPLMDGTTLMFPIASSVAAMQQHDVDGGELYSEVQKRGAGPGLPRADPTVRPTLAHPKPIPTYGRISTLPSSPLADSRPQRCGKIVKKAKKGKKWKELFFVLVADKRRLEYFESEDAFKPKGIVDLASSAVYPLHVSYFGRPNCFQIIVQSSVIYLNCDTDLECRDWVDALRPFVSTCGYGTLTPDVNRVSRLIGVHLSIMEAKKYGSRNTAPYCIVCLGGVKTCRTPVKQSKKDNAFWAEDFVLDNLSDIVDNVQITLYNRGKVKDRTVGELSISLADLTPNLVSDKWWPVSVDGAKGASMRIKITFVSTSVLPLAEYSELSTQLTDDSLAPVLVLAEVTKAQLAEVGKHLVRLWLASGQILGLTHVLVSRDVASEQSTGTLFRGNTLATKVLDQFMKETALPFLHAAIREPVRVLFEDRASCELDPTRKGRNENLPVLLDHVQGILGGVEAQVAHCPPPLRAVLQSVRQLASQRWAKEPLVQYTSVSAFIFLRLVCPAVLNPKLFNMLPDFPSETTARNLTLVAKVIQNAANMTEFGEKEPYMAVCNDFLRANSTKMQALIRNLSTVDSKEAAVAAAAAATGAEAPGAAQYALANISQLASTRRKPLEKIKSPVSKALLKALAGIDGRSKV
eukprot:m.369383 g.369383  ORF g.369383 m.369383 type:complete len:953 (-) comp28121_c0_seq1:13326-16184(-)